MEEGTKDLGKNVFGPGSVHHGQNLSHCVALCLQVDMGNPWDVEYGTANLNVYTLFFLDSWLIFLNRG